MIPARAAIALLLVASSGHAEEDADTEVARRHFERGGALYQQRRYEEAVRAFEEARRLKPLPAFDYNIGRAYDRMGAWGQAAEAYERYLRATPAPSDAEEVRVRLAKLKERLAPPAATEPSAGRGPKIGGAVLMAVGLASAGGGVAFGVLGDQAADDLTRLARAMGTFDPAREDAFKLDRTLEATLLVAGAAVVVAGAILFAVGLRARPAPRASAAR